MFCTNCGKEIIDTARFCNFCGTPIQNMAASIPVQPIQPVQPAQSQPIYPQPVQPAPDFSESTGIPAAENIFDSVPGDITETADNAESVAETERTETADPAEAPAKNTVENMDETTANAVPTPNTIPTYGESESVFSAPPAYPSPAQSMTIPVQSAVLTPENKPERKYTLGHIMMCLAAVAVMAIVAGVFAGLYFSVV